MANSRRTWSSPQEFAQTVITLWRLDCSTKEIANELQTTIGRVEQALIDFYRQRDGEQARTIKLDEFHPLTVARIHQAVVNDSSESA